jgi:hypothetical protein
MYLAVVKTVTKTTPMVQSLIGITRLERGAGAAYELGRTLAAYARVLPVP